MASTPGFEPGPHWWEASALTTVPFLAPVDSAIHLLNNNGAWFPGRKVGVDSCHLKGVRSAQSHLGVCIEDFGIRWEVWRHCLRLPFKKKKKNERIR